MGPYCEFCGFRCFVQRVIPSGTRAGDHLLLATCLAGMAHDREVTGFDQLTATVPGCCAGSASTNPGLVDSSWTPLPPEEEWPWPARIAARLEAENADLLDRMKSALEFLKSVDCECVRNEECPEDETPCGRCVAIFDLSIAKVHPALEDAVLDGVREAVNRNVLAGITEV